MVCQYLHDIKQASRKWFLNFDEVLTSFGLKDNVIDQCFYLKTNGNKFIILVMYVTDI